MNQLAVIGAGAIAQSQYIPALVEHPDVSLTWIVDTNEERAKAVAAETESAQYATDHTVLLSEVDAVILATPPKFHEAIARECIEEGVAVLTEKPVALSAQKARELTDLSAERSVPYAISRQFREAPACRLLKFLVEQDTIGTIQNVSARFGDETKWDFASSYRISEQLGGGGVMADKGPHLLDVLSWVLDEQISVGQYTDDSYGGLEANAELAVSFPELGATGTLEITGSRSIPNYIEISGSDGRMRAKPDGTTVTVLAGGMDTPSLVTTAEEDPPTSVTERMSRQVDRFVESLETGTATYVPAETGVHILEVIEDCYANRERMSNSWEEVSVTDGGQR